MFEGATKAYAEGADAVASYLADVNAELGKAMAYTGCRQLSKMDPTVIHAGKTV